MVDGSRLISPNMLGAVGFTAIRVHRATTRGLALYKLFAYRQLPSIAGVTASKCTSSHQHELLVCNAGDLSKSIPISVVAGACGSASLSFRESSCKCFWISRGDSACGVGKSSSGLPRSSTASSSGVRQSLISAYGIVGSAWTKIARPIKTPLTRVLALRELLAL